MTYAEATPAAELARDLARKDARVGARKVSAMSVRDIREATKAVRSVSRTARARSGEEKEARSAARKLQGSLRKEGMTSVKAQALRKGGVWGVPVGLPTEDAARMLG